MRFSCMQSPSSPKQHMSLAIPCASRLSRLGHNRSSPTGRAPVDGRLNRATETPAHCATGVVSSSSSCGSGGERSEPGRAWAFSRGRVAKVAQSRLSVPTDKGSNAGAKVMALVAGMLAGADSIDDMNLLRHGGMGRLFDRTYAPATLGSFLPVPNPGFNG